MYFRIRMKQEFKNKGLLFLFLAGLLFSGIWIYFREQGRAFTDYSVSMINLDKTMLSENLVKELRRSEVYREENSDFVYEIRKGYERRLLEGDLEGLIGVKKYPSLEVLDIMNDKIGSEIIRTFIYHDLFRRMEKEKQMTFLAYEESLKQTRKENEILSLNVVSEISVDKMGESDYNGFVRYGKYVFFLILLWMGGYVNLLTFQKIGEFRESGLRYRLKLSSISEGKMVGTEFLANHIRIFSLFLGLFPMIKEIRVSHVVLSVSCLYFSFLVFYIIEIIVKNTLIYKVFAMGTLFMLLGVGSFLLYFKL